MVQIANQYSYIFAGFLLLLLAAGLLAWRRRGLRLREFGILLAVGAMLGLGWLASRPAEAAPLDAGQIRARIGQGTPLLLEFQSPFCLGCASQRTRVDAIEKRFAGKLVVLRVDVTDPAGRAAGLEFDFQYTPTFILFDAEGNELWRVVGNLDEERLARSLEP